MPSLGQGFHILTSYLLQQKCISSSTHMQIFTGPTEAPPKHTLSLSGQSLLKDTEDPGVTFHLSQ